MSVETRGTSTRTLRMFMTSGSIAVVAQYLSSLVLARVVLRDAGMSTFGVWATISSLLAIGGLADAGIKMELGRRVAEAAALDDWPAVRRVVHEGTTLLAFIASAVVLVGVAATPLIRAFAFPGGVPEVPTSELDTMLRATFVLLGLTLVADGYCAVLRGVQRSDVEMRARVAGLIVGTIVSVGAINAGWGLWGLLLGAYSIAIVQIGLQIVRASTVVPEASLRLVSLRGRPWRGMLGLSTLLLLSQLSDVVDSQWDKIVLSRYVGSDAVANFQVGVSLVLQTKALALLPLAPLLVAMTELRRDDERRRVVFHQLSSLTIFLGTVALAAVVVFVSPFLRLWLDQELPEAVTAARLFAVAVGLNLLVAPLAYKAIADGRHRITAIASLSNIAVNAALSLLLTIALGSRGPLYGSIAGNAVASVLFLVLMRHDLAEFTSRATWCIPLSGIATCAVLLAMGFADATNWFSLLAGAALLVMVITVLVRLTTGFAPWRTFRKLGVMS